MLNLGQGVANDDWMGRGPAASRTTASTSRAPTSSPSTSIPWPGIDKPDGENYLWYVAKGVDRLAEWTGGRKLVWNCIECTHIGEPEHKATPGAGEGGGLDVPDPRLARPHLLRPPVQADVQRAALLDDPEMLAAVTAINRQVQELAPVLNSPTVADAATVTSSASTYPST